MGSRAANSFEIRVIHSARYGQMMPSVLRKKRVIMRSLFQAAKRQPYRTTGSPGLLDSEAAISVSSAAASGLSGAPAHTVSALLWILGVGFGARLLAVVFLYGEQLAPERDHFEFGWELGRVARSVAAGHGFASPLFGDTGPTAWLPPVNVYLLAVVFRLFGTYTTAAAIAILTLNSLFSALTAWPIFAIARRLFGRTVAVRAAWMWAFFPYAIFIAATRVWGESLDALLIAVVVLTGLRMSETSRRTIWLAGGLLTGSATLTNPNTLSIVPALWGWACWSLSRTGRQWTRPLGLAFVALFLVVAPWFVRNTYVFNELLPFRSNFWLEAYIANNPEAPVMLVDWNRHPASNSSELAEYRDLQELGYMKAKRKQALAYIGSHPATFAALTLRRIVFVWTGFWSWNQRYLASEPFRLPFILFGTLLSLFMLIGLRAGWQAIPSTVLLAAMLLCQPLVYYVTHPAPEYRHAIDPVIVILATFGVLAFRSTIVQTKARWSRGREAVSVATCPVAANPITFVRLTVRRIVFVWTGFWSFDPRYLASEPLQVPYMLFNTTLSTVVAAGFLMAWRFRNQAGIPLATVAWFYPIFYYVTHPVLDYRHAITLVMIITAVFGVAGLRNLWTTSVLRFGVTKLTGERAEAPEQPLALPAPGIVQGRLPTT